MIEVLGPAEIYKGVRYMPVTEEFQQKFDHELEIESGKLWPAGSDR